MENILQEKDFYKGSDISLFSALCCYGYQIEAIDKQNPSKVIFLIRKDENLEDLVKQYFMHELKVEPASYFGFLREIKTRIYNID